MIVFTTITGLLILAQYLFYLVATTPPAAIWKRIVPFPRSRPRLMGQFRPHLANVLPVLLYLAVTAALLWEANLGQSDDKSIFIALQLPIAIPLILLEFVPFVPRDIGWIAAYAILLPPTLAAIYAAFSLLRFLVSWLPRTTIALVVLGLVALVFQL